MHTWFGPKPWGQLCQNGRQVPTPVGENCLFCEDKIEAEDNGQMMPFYAEERATYCPVHRECLIRSVVGSVGHQNKRCSCYGGTEEDPVGMSRRDAAKAACALFEEKLKGEKQVEVGQATSPEKL